MNFSKPLFFLSLATALLFPACTDEADDFKVDFGFEYFPLSVGKFIVFEVDSLIFNPTGPIRIDSSKTFFKEEIVDTLLDNEGNVLFKIERFERKTNSLPWQITKVMTASINDNKAIRTEDNLRFIKMVFPVDDNKTWNGNVFFDPNIIINIAGETIEMFKGWSYRFDAVGVSEVIGDLTFDDLTTLTLADNENLIELRRVTEKYAKGIGLVYRELWILDTQCIEQCAGQGWIEKAEKGFVLKQKVLDFN